MSGIKEKVTRNRADEKQGIPSLSELLSEEIGEATAFYPKLRKKSKVGQQLIGK